LRACSYAAVPGTVFESQNSIHVVDRESWVVGRASGLRPRVIVTYRAVLPQSGVSSTGTRFPVDIRRLPWIKPLAADYAHAFTKLGRFFGGKPADPGAWRDTIARVQNHAKQRDGIAGVLSRQQARRGAPAEAVAAAGRLREPSTVAIVTGQQAGLFG